MRPFRRGASPAIVFPSDMDFAMSDGPISPTRLQKPPKQRWKMRWQRTKTVGAVQSAKQRDASGWSPEGGWGAAAARASEATRALVADTLAIVCLLNPVVRSLNTARFPAASCLFLVSVLSVLSVFRLACISIDLHHSRWLLERDDKNARAAFEQRELSKKRLFSQMPQVATLLPP